MRLGGCILLELVVGMSLFGGTGSGLYFGGRAILESVGGSRVQVARAQAVPVEPGGQPRAGEASAGAGPTSATPRPVAQPAAARLFAPPVDEPVGAGGTAETLFCGRPDAELIAPLRSGRVERVKFNQGGSSISLRIDFDNGARAAFKPDQSNLQTVPRKEVAAFRLDRMLGLGGVPPAVTRSLPSAELVAAMVPESRALLPRYRAEVTVGADGLVTGELSWWIPELADALIDGNDIRDVDGMVLWKRALTVGASIPDAYRALVEQISAMVVFDVLTNNSDRWSGSNTKASPDGRVLYYMDNTLSFGAVLAGHSKVWSYLQRVEKFSRSLHRRLRELSVEQVRRAMTTDTGPYERLLSEREIEGVMVRRDRILEYIDGLIAKHGEAAVLVFE